MEFSMIWLSFNWYEFARIPHCDVIVFFSLPIFIAPFCSLRLCINAYSVSLYFDIQLLLTLQKSRQGKNMQVSLAAFASTWNTNTKSAENHNSNANRYRLLLSYLIPPKAEKDLGFLRIGSLNVRVKKTTEAFSNFLGVGSSTMPNGSGHRALHARSSAPARTENFDKLHKNWGSADNIPPVSELKMFKQLNIDRD